MRTTESTITFLHPFALADLETEQPPGRYRLVTEEEEIPGSRFAFRRTATLLHLPALSTTGGVHRIVSVAPREWAAVIEGDRRGGGRLKP